MAVNPHPTKKGIWVIDYRPQGKKGKRVRLDFEGNEPAARTWESELRRQHRELSAPRINPSINEVIPDFIHHYKNDHLEQTVSSVQRCLKILLPFFGKLQFTALTPTIIEGYKGKRLKDGVKKRTVNKELAYLSALVRWATEMRICNPLPFKIKGFPPKQAKAPIPIIPSPAEIQSLIEAFNPRHRGLILLMYDAGLRSSEARFLRAEDIDLQNLIIIVTGKGNKQRIVPITTGRLIEELTRKVNEKGQGYLYPSPITGRPYNDIRTAIENAAQRAGITKHIYPHLLRHSHGTHAMASGVNLRALQGAMGHSSSQVTELYTHLAADYLRSEMGKFGDTLEVPAPGAKKSPAKLRGRKAGRVPV